MWEMFPLIIKYCIIKRMIPYLVRQYTSHGSVVQSSCLATKARMMVDLCLSLLSLESRAKAKGTEIGPKRPLLLGSPGWYCLLQTPNPSPTSQPLLLVVYPRFAVANKPTHLQGLTTSIRVYQGLDSMIGLV